MNASKVAYHHAVKNNAINSCGVKCIGEHEVVEASPIRAIVRRSHDHTRIPHHVNGVVNVAGRTWTTLRNTAALANTHAPEANGKGKN
eukprot:9322262-Pyramimonas_sp.AAC.2